MMYPLLQLLCELMFPNQSSLYADTSPTCRTHSYRHVVILKTEIIIEYPGLQRIIVDTHLHQLTIGQNRPIQYLQGTFTINPNSITEKSNQIRIEFTSGAILILSLKDQSLTIEKRGESLMNIILKRSYR